MVYVNKYVLYLLYLLPDVCGCLVSWDVSVDVCSDGMCFAGRVLPITCFVFQRFGFSDTEKDNIRNAHLSQ